MSFAIPLLHHSVQDDLAETGLEANDASETLESERYVDVECCLINLHETSNIYDNETFLQSSR